MLSPEGTQALLAAASTIRRRASETMLVALALYAHARKAYQAKYRAKHRKALTSREPSPYIYPERLACQWVTGGVMCGTFARFRLSGGHRYCREHTNAHFRGERSGMPRE